jgi:hypothetical protein
MVTLLVLAGLAGAPDSVISNAGAQYASDGQYGAGGQYASDGQYATDAQYGTTPSCEQTALDALSSPDLESNSAKDNRKLLSELVKCGGTISSLPQESFNTLLMQGNIELDVVGSNMFACPAGDKRHCSPASGT